MRPQPGIVPESDNCHRKVVAQRLYDDYNVNAKHIGRTGSITNHVNADKKSNTNVKPNASSIRQATGHDQRNAQTNDTRAHSTSSLKDVATDSELNEPKR